MHGRTAFHFEFVALTDPKLGVLDPDGQLAPSLPERETNSFCPGDLRDRDQQPI